MTNKIWLKKKRVLIFIFGIVILFLLFYFGRLSIMCQKNYSNAGWKCDFRRKNILNTLLESILRQKCVNERGAFLSDTYYRAPIINDSNYHMTCDIDYSDSGKICSNSNECQGGCVVKDIPQYCIGSFGIPKRNHIIVESQSTTKTNYYTCSKPITGTCSKNRLNNEYSSCFDGWFELDDSLIIEHTWHLCNV